MTKKLLLPNSLLLLLCIIGVAIFWQPTSFGRLPKGERLERIKKSSHYRDGSFVNFSETPIETGTKSKFRSLWDFIVEKTENARPKTAVPHVKLNLKRFQADENVMVWLGHSSLYVQVDGKKILIDPVLVSASPVSFLNKPFPGSATYTPADMPDIDYLLITHDHWDHLDYNTVLQLKERVTHVICPLGVGEHFEYWGYDQSKITELDWHDEVSILTNMRISAVPARHFSGRALTQNKTLWAGYVIDSSLGTIYVSGDTGYDSHFIDIRKRYGPISLAILENGQYDSDWKYIHMLPNDLVKAVKNLAPERLMTVHNSKYVLAKHPWKEPLEKIAEAAQKDSVNLLSPKIGEPVHLDQSNQHFDQWWKEIN